MSRRKEFKILEKRLEKKFINVKENEVILRDDDFKDGKLTKSGYLSLKLQSNYIPTYEDLEVRIPESYASGFKDQLEYVGTKELIRIKTDMKVNILMAIIFFVIGTIIISLPTLFSIFKTNVINEITLVVSWVFVWASIEKGFFITATLNNRRINILHIITSKIVTY